MNLIGQRSRSRVMAERWSGGGEATQRYKQRLAGLVQSGMRILHAGCGWDKKEVSLPYIHTCKVVGVDLDPRVAPMFHSEFHLGSLTEMPFESATFELIFCEYVVEHLDDPKAAFHEMRRVLKPGGRVLLLTPSLFSYKVLAAACTPHQFHIWMGRIRYGRGQEADMYPTLYRCNTAARFRTLAEEAGLETVGIDFVTNGPTWFERFPVLFEIFDRYHRTIARWDALRQLRCALVVELRNPDPARSMAPGPQ